MTMGRELIDWKAEVPKGKKPLGKMGPWLWAVELVNGCNLACWHCTARILPKGRRFMSLETWKAACRIMAEITPRTRLEFGQLGEPTLHPQLLEIIAAAKQITPTTQVKLYTNGVTLLSGKVSLEQMFDVGLHCVYIDMYDRPEKYEELAKQSGAEWYHYYKPKTTGTEGHRMSNNYYGDPDMRLVVLQHSPETRIRWRKVGRLSTFLNHIDWQAAMPHGLVPVRNSYERKCTIPMRFATINWEGFYQFCCIDFMAESAGLMGNVSEGVEGFKRYWFGRMMQSIRRRLHEKDRAGVPYCSRCNCAFSKSDWTGMWGGPDAFEQWWDGKRWCKMPSKKKDVEVFADGWTKAEMVQASLPTVEEERRCLEQSGKYVINTTEVARKRKKLGLVEEERR